jgi:hypothetical protein
MYGAAALAVSGGAALLVADMPVERRVKVNEVPNMVPDHVGDDVNPENTAVNVVCCPQLLPANAPYSWTDVVLIFVMVMVPVRQQH